MVGFFQLSSISIKNYRVGNLRIFKVTVFFFISEEGPASSDSKKGDSQLPADFFDSATNTNKIEKTPWQQEKEEKVSIFENLFESNTTFQEQIITAGKNLIEGVPHGFFDDRRKDLKVRFSKFYSFLWSMCEKK